MPRLSKSLVTRIDLTGPTPVITKVRGPGNVARPDEKHLDMVLHYVRENYPGEFEGMDDEFLTFNGSPRRLLEIQRHLDGVLSGLRNSDTRTVWASVPGLNNPAFYHFVGKHLMPGFQGEHYFVRIYSCRAEICVTWDCEKMGSLSFGEEHLARCMDEIAEFASEWTCEEFKVDELVGERIYEVLGDERCERFDDSVFVMHDKPDFANWFYSDFGEDHEFTQEIVPFGYTPGSPLVSASVASWFANQRKGEDKLGLSRFWTAEIEYDDPNAWESAPNPVETLHSTPFWFTLHLKVITGNPFSALEDAMFFLGQKIAELRGIHENRRRINELPTDDEEEEEEDLDARTEAINAGRICGVCQETNVEVSSMCGHCSMCDLCDSCRKNPHVESATQCFGCSRDM